MNYWEKTVYLFYSLIIFSSFDAKSPLVQMETHNHWSNPQIKSRINKKSIKWWSYPVSICINYVARIGTPITLQESTHNLGMKPKYLFNS